MGKKWKGRKRKRDTKVEKPKKERPKTNYEEIVRENANFETYYKAQNFVPDSEWNSFITSLKEDLPAAFRLTGTKAHAKALLQLMQDSFFHPLKNTPIKKIDSEESMENVKKFDPVCLSWYPDSLAWQLNITRKDIRNSETYWKLHQFLISETETGNISRQEAVSMIPPLVLDILPHHKVLDMCAAPGSKTAQMVEFLHNSLNEVDAAIPSGLVVANDADNKRCYMLTHQAKRLQSPTLVITNHDAAFMPNILQHRKDGSVGAMKFDRILCDVPCSGDGTLRKNFDGWSKWHPLNGANLHGLQLRIARRGLEMLSVGGRLVYSTCSLNPLENEAVVNRILAEFGDAVSLVDVRQQLTGLKVVAGCEHWVIMNRELEVILTPEEIPTKNSNVFHKHLFPPTEEEKNSRHLHRCFRILPHHQDTGGFFVAVLQKVKPLPGEKIHPEGAEGEADAPSELTQRLKKPPKKRRRGGFREEPFFYLTEEDPLWESVRDFYLLKEPLNASLFLRRSEEGKGRTLYFTNSLVRDMVILNQDRMKIINTGVKVLARCDNLGSKCGFRLAQDGSQVLLPFMDNRKMYVKNGDLVHMLVNDDVDTPPRISDLHQDTQTQCDTMDCGSVAFVCEEEDRPRIELVGWKGRQSMRCYVAKHDRLHYLRLLRADTTAFEVNKFAEQRLKDNETGTEPSGCKENEPGPGNELSGCKENEPGAGNEQTGSVVSSGLNGKVSLETTVMRVLEEEEEGDVR